MNAKDDPIGTDSGVKTPGVPWRSLAAPIAAGLFSWVAISLGFLGLTISHKRPAVLKIGREKDRWTLIFRSLERNSPDGMPDAKGDGLKMDRRVTMAQAVTSSRKA